MKPKVKGGFLNSLKFEKLHFDYEVVEKGEVKNVEYEDQEGTYTQQECTILIKSLFGGKWSHEEFYCTLFRGDALKNLREGDIISADLHFYVSKNKEGEYTQMVYADSVYSLEDLFQVRKAEAIYKEMADKYPSWISYLETQEVD